MTDTNGTAVAVVEPILHPATGEVILPTKDASTSRP
jgi:hypothetical protein